MRLSPKEAGSVRSIRANARRFEEAGFLHAAGRARALADRVERTAHNRPQETK